MKKIIILAFLFLTHIPLIAQQKQVDPLIALASKIEALLAKEEDSLAQDIQNLLAQEPELAQACGIRLTERHMDALCWFGTGIGAAISVAVIVYMLVMPECLGVNMRLHSTSIFG